MGKIIDLDLQRRRISLSIKQAAEGGVVAAEYQEHFGEHAYDDEGNYIGTDTTEAQEAWAEYFETDGEGAEAPAAAAVEGEPAEVEPEAVTEAVTEAEAEAEAAPEAEPEGDAEG